MCRQKRKKRKVRVGRTSRRLSPLSLGFLL
jgi:hypothetical protein